jgi:hypothetical protein
VKIHRNIVVVNAIIIIIIIVVVSVVMFVTGFGVILPPCFCVWVQQNTERGIPDN